MRQTRVSVSKRGSIQILALMDGVWRSIAIDDDEAKTLVLELLKALDRKGASE